MADIYEKPKRPLWWRFLWYGLWAVVVLAVVWVLVWLLFFRHHNTAHITAPGPSTTFQANRDKTATPAPSPVPKGSSSASSGETGTAIPPSSSGVSSQTDNTSANSTTGVTPAVSQLTNTGPGEVLLPVLAASTVGSTLYYLRLRRRLARS